VPRRALIDGAAAAPLVVLGYVRGHVDLPQLPHKVPGVEVLVPAGGDAFASRFLLDHLQLHLAVRAVELFVQLLRRPGVGPKGSHPVARIFLAFDLLGLGHHPAPPAPGLSCALEELGERPRRFPRPPMFLFGLLHGPPDDPPQSRVAREAQHVVHAVLFTPGQQLLTAEARVPAQNDSHLGPAPANLRDDPRDFLAGSAAAVQKPGILVNQPSCSARTGVSTNWLTNPSAGGPIKPASPRRVPLALFPGQPAPKKSAGAEQEGSTP
jgi:hypothetical protein